MPVALVHKAVVIVCEDLVTAQLIGEHGRELRAAVGRVGEFASECLSRCQTCLVKSVLKFLVHGGLLQIDTHTHAYYVYVHV